ncbi:aldose epimerase family protein [Streptomyces sp. NPDC048506]|uniref:aldose epimerase family protein n=1 Tax=Streptomyces sp. NPDC048506 TaxID=3155028 RepID=UPI00343D291E
MAPGTSVRRRVVGTVPSGPGTVAGAVESFTLDNGRGLAVTVWTWGATLVEVLTPDRHGRVGNVVLRLPDLDAYRDRTRNPYVGATVGRYCRCVAQGRLLLDGVVHTLDRNDGAHHVHGGGEGFDRRIWSAESAEDDRGIEVRLTLDSADGDQGYPGAVRAQCGYRVDTANRLTIWYTAVTTAPTVVGLTNHAFWNLAGSGTVDGHRLALNSVRVVPFDAELIPLAGPPHEVAGSELDFGRPRRLGAQRLDTFYALDAPAWAARLHDPRSGRTMSLVTDQSGMGVYSADHSPWPRAGLCLETGPWPDAPNRPDFPSARLDPGEVYRARTTHTFSTDTAERLLGTGEHGHGIASP